MKKRYASLKPNFTMKTKAEKPEIDRFITRPLTQKEKNLRQYKFLTEIFDDTEPTGYQQQLCNAFFGMNYSKARTARIRDLVYPIQNSSPEKLIYSIKRERILEAPEIREIPTSTPFSWSPNGLLIGLGHTTYRYNYQKVSIQELKAGTINNSVITALCVNPMKNVLLRAGADNSVRLIDPNNDSEITKYNSDVSHGLVALGEDDNSFYMGSISGSFLSQIDYRSLKPNLIDLKDHTAAGLAFNKRDDTLAVCTRSKTVDNTGVIQLFDIRQLSKPRVEYTGHVCPGKAIEFAKDSSRQIVSGGATSDKKIHLWDTLDGEPIATADAGNQISGVHWYDDNNILVVNQSPNPGLTFWSSKKSKLTQKSSNHSQNVISYSALSPDHSQIITGSPPDTITFFAVGVDRDSKKTTPYVKNYPPISTLGPSIR